MKPNFNEEKKLWKRGIRHVVGLDEVGRGCEKPDAEVLTNNGWRFYKDITLEDKVLSYSDEGYMEWQKIEKIVEKDYDGNLIELKNRGINIVVTPDHYFPVLRRVFKRDKKDGNALKLVRYKMRPERKMVGELNKNDFIPRGGRWMGESKNNFMLPAIDSYKENSISIKLWVAFLGIFLSEGSVHYHQKSGSYKITISQSRMASPGKYKKISKLLMNLPFHFNSFENGFNCHHKQLYVYLKKLGDKYEKFVPVEFKNLHSDVLSILIEWMLLGDGSSYMGKNRKKVSTYYTVSEKLRDDFEEVLLKAGWTYHTVKRAVKDRYINGRLIKKENQVGCFEIRMRSNNKAHTKSLHKNEISYRGKVFCLQLYRYHNFFVRRGGTGYFTGNSLAGPVVAAAVIVRHNSPVVRTTGLKINDSKKLSEKQREYFYRLLTNHEDIMWSVGIVSEKVIDKINILEATKLAMQKAAQKVIARSDRAMLLLDGNFKIRSKVPQKSIIKGDAKVFSIAAASIIAKVTRDRLMQKMHKKFPQYEFAKHKGYGTALHIKHLKTFGPCKIHRKSFYPVSSIAKT